MIRSIASFFFYSKFLREFSALGYERRAKRWKALKPDYRGQRWLVTGATGGIGRALVLAGLRGGATVIAAARSEAKLEQLRNDCSEPERLISLRVDLSSIAEVDAIANRAELAGKAIDVLINNVGVLLNEYSQTEEGLEASFATNIVGHLVLTEGLLDHGMLAADGAVINMSSGGMYGTPIKTDEMAAESPKGYDGMAAYATHKRAQVALTNAWNAQWKGSPKAYVMHPGWADTEGVRSSLPWFRAALKRFLRDADQAADTALWLARIRPPVAAEGGIWLDRELHSEHAFSFTKQSQHTPKYVQQFLHLHAAEALS